MIILNNEIPVALEQSTFLNCQMKGINTVYSLCMKVCFSINSMSGSLINLKSKYYDNAFFVLYMVGGYGGKG